MCFDPEQGPGIPDGLTAGVSAVLLVANNKGEESMATAQIKQEFTPHLVSEKPVFPTVIGTDQNNRRSTDFYCSWAGMR